MTYCTPLPSGAGIFLPGLLAAALGLSGCDRPSAGPSAPDGPAIGELVSLPTPAGPYSGEPTLASGPDGVLLSWIERANGGGHALRIASWDGRAWTEPVTVTERSEMFVNWADFPAVAALEDGTLLAHWLEKSGPGTYSYDVRMALSRDGGASWGPDVIPHRDGVEAEHGFVSLLPLEDRFGAVWLDGRETVDGGTMTVRFTTVAPDGSLGEEELVDGSACDCCQTAAAVTADGIVTAYRDRTADEVRDIHVARRIDGSWTEPRPVHDDGWVIAACPVNGPAIAAADRRVVVAWFTGAPENGSPAERSRGGEQGRVLLAFSTDSGESFGAPLRVDEGAAMGRVDVELLDDGSALVTWLERVDGRAEVRVRRANDAGVGPFTIVTGTRAERASGFPRMLRRGDRILFAWTEAGEIPRVRTAEAILEAGEREPLAGHDTTDGGDV